MKLVFALTLFAFTVAGSAGAADGSAPKSGKPTAKPAAKPAKASGKLMVPPPPPEIPLVGAQDERILSTLGVPLDYMSKGDLQNLETRLEQSLNKLQKQSDERQASLKERRQRSTQFDELFKEGVVSKRELERAHKELEDIEDDGNELDFRLRDARTDLERVRKQLAIVEKKDAKRKDSAGPAVGAKTKVTKKAQ